MAWTFSLSNNRSRHHGSVDISSTLSSPQHARKLRPPSMADTLDPPCTSWCPFWWWRCLDSGPNWHLCALYSACSQGGWCEGLLCPETLGSSADWSRPPRWSWSRLVRTLNRSPRSSRSSLAGLIPSHQLWSWGSPRIWGSTRTKARRSWGWLRGRASFLIWRLCGCGSAAGLVFRGGLIMVAH